MRGVRLGVKDDLLLLDLTNSFKDGRAQLLVMALMERGAYTDEEGYLAQRANPEENTESTLLELRVTEDAVEVMKPVPRRHFEPLLRGSKQLFGGCSWPR